jgi:hypothetical protein
MSSQACAAAPVSLAGIESAGGLSAAARHWLAQRWADETAGPVVQGIEQADGVDGSAIGKTRGDLDLCSSPELQSALAGLLRTRRPTILDLSAIRLSALAEVDAALPAYVATNRSHDPVR